jgi:hypothetical protein
MQARCTQDAEAAAVVAWLATLPGRSPTTAPVIVAEMGTDRARFPSAAARAAWAGRAPGHNERAGPQRRGRTRTGNGWRRTILVQAAQAAAHTTDTARVARSRRRAARRGHTQAVVALAHALLVIISHVMARRPPSQELGADAFQRLDPTARAQRLVHHLLHLGFAVELRAQQMPAPTGDTPALAGGS